jgi:hypothetical protein
MASVKVRSTLWGGAVGVNVCTRRGVASWRLSLHTDEVYEVETFLYKISYRSGTITLYYSGGWI